LISFLATNITFPPPPPFFIPEGIKIGMTKENKMIFNIALLGKTLGLFVVLKKSSHSTRVTNLFIANMAVADLLLTFTMTPDRPFLF